MTVLDYIILAPIIFVTVLAGNVAMDLFQQRRANKAKAKALIEYQAVMNSLNAGQITFEASDDEEFNLKLNVSGSPGFYAFDNDDIFTFRALNEIDQFFAVRGITPAAYESTENGSIMVDIASVNELSGEDRAEFVLRFGGAN